MRLCAQEYEVSTEHNARNCSIVRRRPRTHSGTGDNACIRAATAMHDTRANQQHRAPLIEMFLIAIPQYSRVASVVDDASADTSTGSAPAATTAPRCASARRSTKLMQTYYGFGGLSLPIQKRITNTET